MDNEKGKKVEKETISIKCIYFIFMYRVSIDQTERFGSRPY